MPPLPDSGPTPGNDAGNVLTVTAVSPAHGPLDGGTAVVISGSGFSPGLSVSFGSRSALTFTVVSDSVLDATTPPASDAGAVDVAVTLPEGTALLKGGYSYDPAPLPIPFCVLHFPSKLSGDVGQSPGTVYGWVYIPGVTDLVGQGAGVQSQVGYGKTGSTPDQTWSWSPATYDGDKDGLSPNANDEYAGALPVVPVAGTYDYAVRFSRDQGATWVACDTVGVPYAPGNAGMLTVSTPIPLAIGFCQTHFPTALAVSVGQAAGPVYGWVYVAGLTDQGPDAGPGVLAQLGQGPLGSVPDDVSWAWVPARFNAKQGTGGHDDEYLATLPAQGDAGTFAYAYRFALDGGPFVACDTLGTAAYAPTNQALLTVTEADAGSSAPPGSGIDWCDLQFPATLTAGAGQDAGPVYGQVYKAGVTDSAGQGAGLVAALGVGPPSGDPTAPDGGFRWTAASYDADRGSNDEYEAALKAPGDAGSYAYYFRFSATAGAGWTVCGYQAPIALGGDAGALTVP